jgi:hypothetical protein
MHLKEWSLINLIIVEERLRAVHTVIKEWHFRIEGELDAARQT